MARQIFVNLPVKDLQRSIAFFTRLGFCLSCDSRAEVDQLAAKAVAAGGAAPRKPQDHGFMYQHGFEDVDGHLWELVYMRPSATGKA
jgi:predicted lactoylglutathione lyase